MKKIIKSGLKLLLNKLVSIIGKTSIGRYLYHQVILNQMEQTQKIEHNGISLFFTIPNALNRFRADTFSTKEPETLEWIDNMPNDSVIWDIGANVGLYSCYAAKRKKCKVFSFEPSVFNLELLARNVFLNSVVDLITIVPLPLSDSLSINSLNMTTTEWGGALSTFGKSYGHDGKILDKKFEFSTMGLSMEDAHMLLNIPKPEYIKMDVDGIEHLILGGGKDILKCVKSILVEINDDFKLQAKDSERYLKEAGLTLKEKRRWVESESSPFEGTYNQIWYRN